MKAKRIFMSVLCVMLMCSFTLFTGCGGSDEDAAAEPEVTNPVKVTCENGVMLGQTTDGVNSWKGIPFAKPPVGDLRWKAPEAPDPSDEEVECYKFGLQAIQYEWASEPASSLPRGEDCLTLNIWASEDAMDSDEPKPVMVFFHGGAYSWGGTGDPTYDGQEFVKAHPDVILITCNYRLGVMSWADFSQVPGGEEYTDVNLGLRDNICALEWIQKNVGNFGGDADNVTIFGESAGGFTTTALVISPMAQGLFKRAIAESGTVDLKDRQAAVDFADVIVETTGAKNMDDLLAITSDEWIELDETNWMSDECCGAVADGEVLPEYSNIESAMATAIGNGIQLLTGSNKDEWNYFRNDQGCDTPEEDFDTWYNNDLKPYWKGTYKNGDDSAKAAMDEFYKYEEELVPEEYAKDKTTKDALVKSAFKTETWRYQIMDFADKYANAGGEVYSYLWCVPSEDDLMYKSAVHAVELSYVFNTVEDAAYAGTVDIPSAKRVQNSWVNFAKTGNPSIKSAEWTKYNTSTRDVMVMNKDGWKMESDPFKTARELMATIYANEELPPSYDHLYIYNIWE